MPQELEWSPGRDGYGDVLPFRMVGMDSLPAESDNVVEYGDEEKKQQCSVNNKFSVI